MGPTALVFPHQLYAEHPALLGAAQVLLIEEPLLFSQYRFHRQKLLFHRATMQHYAESLSRRNLRADTIESHQLADTASLAVVLRQRGIRDVRYVDPCDDWLATRLASALDQQGITATVLDDPHFLTPDSAIDEFTAGKEHLFFTEFYIAQRKRLGLLLDERQKPRGGKWSFDPENRRKLSKDLPLPAIPWPAEGAHVRAAREYVREHFPNAPGSDADFTYPIDSTSATEWLHRFVRERLPLFGDYEDAISTRHTVLFHSVLTPLLNVGLLSPAQVIEAALAQTERVPLNSLEGFVRQVIGWREFVRLVYRTRGRRQRCRNYWGFARPMPSAFYDGTTGIEPVDHVIRQVLRTGYCHHIERLMILGNFLLLCEVAPDAVYQWFMELFIDAYDWVMVPNVYGMSQHADGGLMTTKPYISGSAYVLKMSDFKKGPWCPIWDALYWRFVDNHANFFQSNPRTSVIVRARDKLGAKLTQHRETAERFLARLSG